MARRRQARRCRAKRTDGKPCRAWAIVGGTVCMAHGGAASQVQAAAAYTSFKAWAQRAFAHQMERERRARVVWMARRVALASDFFGIPVAEVHMGHVWWAESELGIRGVSAPPKVPLDRRFRAPRPPGAPRAARSLAVPDNDEGGGER